MSMGDWISMIIRTSERLYMQDRSIQSSLGKDFQDPMNRELEGAGQLLHGSEGKIVLAHNTS